jgi:lycopene cyclase domain-containing protein
MSWLYLAGLVVSMAGLVAIDARFRLFLFAAPLRAVLVLALGVGGFLAWDLLGITAGVFFEGSRRLLVGVDLAPQLPLEEVAFLVLLCETAMVAATLARRVLDRRSPPC